MRPFLPVLPATCGYVGILAAFTAMLPAVVCGAAAGGLASEAAQDPTKYFLTCLHLLVQVGMALKDLVLSHKTLATTRGLANRVGGLLDALDSSVKAAPSQAPKPPPNAMAAAATPLLQLRGLSVSTPKGATLLKDVTLDVCPGQRILVCGPGTVLYGCTVACGDLVY